VDSRRWWLLAAAAPVALGCALAAADPALRPAGEISVVAAGLIAAVVLWTGAPRAERARGWRVLAVAPLFPVLGSVAALAVDVPDPRDLAVLRWIPTVPGYLLAIVGILCLVDRRRLRAGSRIAVEVALFLSACLVVVGMLVVGPAGRSALGIGRTLVIDAAVLATSATMAAALVLLGVVEPHRRRMALVLLAGAVLLTGGRTLGTAAMFTGADMSRDVARFLVAAGLLLLAWAALLDTRRAPASSGRRLADLGSLLPHLALLVAVATVGGSALSGNPPSRQVIAGLVVCVTLAAAHRWLTSREEQRLQTRLRRSEAYFRSLVRASGDAVVILDDRLHISAASPALGALLGEAADALLGRPLLDTVHPEDRPALAAALPTEPGAVEQAGLLLVRLQDAAGVWRYLEAGVSDLRADAEVGAVVLHCRDLTERLAREQALQNIAYTDPMTGLPNRPRFLHLLDEAAAAGSDGRTLLMVQIDGIAEAREHTGREAITHVVAEIGRRLRATVRGEDVVARLGGGAFGILAEGDVADVDRLAARCLSVIEQPILTRAGLVDLTATIGVVPVETGLGEEELLTRADLAMRAAYARGVGVAARYEPALGEAAAREDRLREDLRGARERDELFLSFQPIVSLHERRVTGIEAVPYWRHPSLGEIPTAEFLGIAERAGLAGDVIRWAMEQATGALADLPAADGARVGLKVPTGYVATGTLVPDVEHALRRSGLSPERFVLQLTSDTVGDDEERTALDVSTLRFMGVHVALDGFGSGASTLAHLTRLDIDIVRLDRSLITRIDRDPQSRALCESIIGIGHGLGLDVVAEGVETSAQLGVLCGFGCDFAQGFAISRPLPLGALTELLAGRSERTWPGLVTAR
jgi:diguanylate cyclase (GGDEF)-like protein/PAS domain S-box-containing protein